MKGGAEMTNELKHFSVYYLNFDKVFEIAMLFDNKVLTSEEEETEKRHTSKITARVQAMLTAIFKAEGEGSYEYSKASGLRRTVEIKSTNAVILRDVIEEIKSKNIRDSLAEGSLIIIRDLELNIVNEEEMRQMKLIKQGILDRFTHEDIPIGEILKSLASDYSYVLTGKNEGGEFLFKIPSEVKNEFENNYTIDDLLMGKVTLIGIYKGKKKIEDLTSTFNFLTANDQTAATNEIEHSSDRGDQEADDQNTYHFIDTLAIIQELKLGD